MRKGSDMMFKNLEELRLEFDVFLDTQLDTLTSPEIITRGLEIEKKLLEQN